MSSIDIHRKEAAVPSSEICFSSLRGNIHGFNLQNDTSPVQVIANGGAQLMNSKHYFLRKRNETSAEIIRQNQEKTTGYMIGFSRPGDTFIFTSSSPELTAAVLAKIRDSYSEVGIGVATDFRPVDNIDHAIKRGDPQIFNVLSPEVLFANGRPVTAVSNVKMYRKDNTEKLWRNSGIPTPPTAYINGRGYDEYLEQHHIFTGYDALVINTVDGSGGFGMSFIPKQDIQSSIEKYKQTTNDETLQIQGLLELAASPCLIYNLGDAGVDFLVGSEQRFEGPGIYAGNLWEMGNESAWVHTYPDFFHTVNSGAQLLQHKGVRGQINIDVLTLSVLVSQKHSLSRVLLREANIRPAGSSVILRLKNDADINGKKPDKILTNTASHIPQEQFWSEGLFESLNRTQDLKTVVYNYYPDTQKAGLAFLGNDNVTISQLKEYEKDTLRSLHAW